MCTKYYFCVLERNLCGWESFRYSLKPKIFKSPQQYFKNSALISIKVWLGISKNWKSFVAHYIFRIFYRKIRFSCQNNLLCHDLNRFFLLLYLLRVKSFHIFLKSFPNVNELFKVRIPRDFSLARATQNWRIIEIGMINRPLTGGFSIIQGSN